jgi:hypothetical protein
VRKIEIERGIEEDKKMFFVLTFGSLSLFICLYQWLSISDFAKPEPQIVTATQCL